MRLPLQRSKKARVQESSSEDDSEELMVRNVEEEEEEDEDVLDNSDNDDDDASDSEESEDEEEGEEIETDDDGDAHKDNEMEELEKEYMDLRQQEQDVLKNLKQHKDEDLQKGLAVKNQKALWDKSLEFRFLLQKAFSTSNRLPKEPVRSSFCALDESVSEAYSDLISSSKKTIDSLLQLQEALIEKHPSIVQSTNGNPVKSSKKHSGDSKNMDGEGDEEWLRISQMLKRVAPFRDQSIDKWQRKTQVTTGAAAIKSKLQAFNQNISEQVAAYMRDPSRMIKQMQQRTSTVGIFGGVAGKVREGVADANGEEVQPDGDPELLDDSEFYQQLLKEFFETIDPTSSEAAFYALKRMQTKKRKIVDRRASKSRKIRYNVHEKIVNFMAAQPMNLPPMAPKLFENLFGLKNPRSNV